MALLAPLDDRSTRFGPVEADHQSTYKASRVKRARATAAEMSDRRERLIEIVRADYPMTVRQVFYRATVEGLIDKSEAGYDKVQVALAKLRRDGALPFGWIVDNTRWQRRPRTFDGVAEALVETARLYRKSLWRDADCYVEFWLEKDALSGVIEPVTFAYDIPLMIARGYSSLSFLHAAAKNIEEIGKPAHIYHLGDYDPSGQNAAAKIEETLRLYAPGADISFTRLAVTPRQIREYELPSRPTKKTDSRAKAFRSPISVELDAIPPGYLRDIVESAINLHLPQDQLEVLRVAEASERDYFQRIAATLTGEAA